jgi:hypothetical protein
MKFVCSNSFAITWSPGISLSNAFKLHVMVHDARAPGVSFCYYAEVLLRMSDLQYDLQGRRVSTVSDAHSSHFSTTSTFVRTGRLAEMWTLTVFSGVSVGFSPLKTEIIVV